MAGAAPMRRGPPAWRMQKGMLAVPQRSAMYEVEQSANRCVGVVAKVSARRLRQAKRHAPAADAPSYGRRGNACSVRHR